MAAAPDDFPAHQATMLARILDPDGQFGYRARLLASEQARIDVPAPRDAAGEYHPNHFSGELSLTDLDLADPAEIHSAEEPSAEEPSAEPPSAEPPPVDAQPTIKRTKVTLTPAAEREDDVRVYIAPPPDGLGKFDLGTVPASVTPPPSWRKAAWFATVSSGGVVVALLVAGSYLVGQPIEQNVAIDSWPGLRGHQPELHDEGFADSSPDSARSTAAPEGSAPERISDLAAVRSSRLTTLTTTSQDGSAKEGGGSVTGTRSATPTTTQEQRKPSPRPAPRDTHPAPFYSFPPDADTMGDRSEIFLNEITENPEKAWEQTGGELRAEGPDGIAARYDEIAYFEIEHIHIDQQKRQTVNTVTVYWKDGDVTSQQRTLKFEEGDKITSD